MDYQSGNFQLCNALDKFVEWYGAAKSKSIPRLSSFLYDLNHNVDPTVNIKSGTMIRVQVESIKRRKIQESGRKRKQSALINENKENLDPHTIPSRKVRKISKKDHNLSKNISKNQPN